MNSKSKLYSELVAGERFRSPRADQGTVQVVCPPGRCSHDERDEFSCHVRGTDGGEFFVIYLPDEAIKIVSSE